ncbi:MAG: hypothetical protein ACXW3J_08230, partial [Methylocystis sp.]
WMQAALERYKMRHTYYGDLRGDFIATGGSFFKQGWLLWIGAAFTAAAYLVGQSSMNSRSKALGSC